MLHPPQRGSTGWEGEQPRWLVANIPPVFCLQRRTAYEFPLCDWNYISLHLRAFAFDAVILPRFAFVEIALTTNSPVWVQIVIVLDVWCFDEQIFGFVEVCWSWYNWENIVNTWNMMFLSNSKRCSIHNCTPIMIILNVWCFGQIIKVRRCSNRKLIIIEHSACSDRFPLWHVNSLVYFLYTRFSFFYGNISQRVDILGKPPTIDRQKVVFVRHCPCNE